MEVEDEMADIDELSMSILEPVPSMLPVNDMAPGPTVTASHEDDNVAVTAVGDVTITINCRGEINVDQSALAEVSDRSRTRTKLSFLSRRCWDLDNKQPE